MKKLLVILVFLFTGFGLVHAEEDVYSCIDDAKQCADGSWVGRTGADCEFVCPEDIACDDIYVPVCASVEVQCIKAPCYPVLQTFDNECQMKKYAIATFLHEGACEESNGGKMAIPATEINSDKPLVCSNTYFPVCGVDGKTYFNDCEVSIIGKRYNGRCLSSSIESKLKEVWDTIYPKYLDGKDDIYTALFLEAIVTKSNVLSRNSDSFVHESSYSYLGFLAGRDLVDKVYTPYIRENIYLVGPLVVGGSISKEDVEFINIKWIAQNTAYVYYKDNIWHKNHSDKIKISVKDGKFVIENLESITSTGFFLKNNDIIITFRLPIEWNDYGYDYYSDWLGNSNDNIYEIKLVYKAKKEINRPVMTLHFYTKEYWDTKNASLDEKLLVEKDGIVVAYSIGTNNPYKIDENISNYSIMLNDVSVILNRMEIKIN